MVLASPSVDSDHLGWCVRLHPASVRGESKQAVLAQLCCNRHCSGIFPSAVSSSIPFTYSHCRAFPHRAELQQSVPDTLGWLFVCECARQRMPDGLYGRRDVVISLHVCWTNLSIQFLLLVISAMRVALSSLCFSSGDKQFFRKKQHYPQASRWGFFPLRQGESQRINSVIVWQCVWKRTHTQMHSTPHQYPAHPDQHCFIFKAK